ncbi:unnamed protein product [uncultured bacterium]|nr:unnamed protein product [uncultured bacterium]
MEPTASVVEISNIILNAGASGENIFNDGGTRRLDTTSAAMTAAVI